MGRLMLLLGEAADKRDNSSCMKLRTTEYVDMFIFCLNQVTFLFPDTTRNTAKQGVLFSYTQDKVHISAVVISKSGQLIPK